MIFFKKRAAIDWIVAGLGNPGKKYDGTRHNVGFEALDVLAQDVGIAVKRSKFEALCGDGAVAGQRVLLLKPQTFMNLSGKSIGAAADFYKIPPQRIIVLCDDVTLGPGMLRIRLSGSDGGHNGLKDIIAHVGQDFIRVRIGVGNKPHPEYDMADWVLSQLKGADKEQVQSRYADVAAAVQLLMQGNSADAMARYNGEKKK